MVNLDKTLKIAIIFTGLLVAFSVFYYSVIFLPQKEQTKLELQRQEQLAQEEIEREKLELKQQEQELQAQQKEAREWQIKCEDYGREKYYPEAERNGDLSILRKYWYSRKLNTCVVEISTYDLQTGNESFILIDMFKEELIYNYRSDCPTEDCPTINDFLNKTVELRGE